MTQKSAFSVGFETPQPELEIQACTIQGEIPEWLSGTLIRNGPGRFDVGSKRLAHWFDGISMLHAFQFENGRVSYKNRFLDCGQKRGVDEGRIDYAEFATDPCRSWFSKLAGMASITPTDSAKISIGKMGDRFMALGETPIQVEFDPRTLDSVGVLEYDPNAIVGMTTAHPHQDGAAGQETAYNLVVSLNAISRYKIMAVDGNSPAGRVVASAPVLQPAYLHSFGMTPTYFVITEFPFIQNTSRLLLWNRPYIENFNWRPKRGTRFWVFERNGGRLVGKYRTEAFFGMHHVNAFESAEGDLVLDIVTYPDSTFIDAFYLKRLELENVEIPEGELRRYTLDLTSGRVEKRVLSDTGIELNHIDYDRDNMRPDYRYVYGIGVSPHRKVDFYNRLVKVDIVTSEAIFWDEPGMFPGEPVFVPAPGRTADDEGVLLSVVVDQEAEGSFLLILDAQNLSEIGRAIVPYPILFGFHGNWFEEI